MIAADAARYAWGAIAAQRTRSALTLAGIAVGIAAVILLTSIGEGIHRFVLGEFTQFGTNVITATPGKTRTGGSPSGLPSSARPLSLEDARSLERLPHVVAVTPNVRGNAEVEGNGRTRRTLIYGVNANLPRVFRSTVQSGQFLPADDEGSARAFVVLGAKLRNELFGSEKGAYTGADSARAGRFDRQVLVDRPDRKGRGDILKVHVRKVKLDPALRLDDVAALIADRAQAKGVAVQVELGDLPGWRHRQGVMLMDARAVLAPSGDVAARFARMWPSAPLRVAPHTDIPADSALPVPRPAAMARTAALNHKEQT